MGQTDLKPTAQGQVESSINDTINFIMAKVAAGEIDAATATELIAAARKDYESNVPVTTSAVNETTISLMAKVPSSVFLDAVACMDSRYMSGHTVDTGHAFTVSPGTYEPYIGIHDPVYGAGYMMVDLDKPFEVPMNRIWIAMDDYSGPETKEGLRGMYHSPQDVSAFSDPFCGSVSVTPTRDEKQEPAKSGLEAKEIIEHKDEFGWIDRACRDAEEHDLAPCFIVPARKESPIPVPAPIRHSRLTPT